MKKLLRKLVYPLFEKNIVRVSSQIIISDWDIASICNPERVKELKLSRLKKEIFEYLLDNNLIVITEYTDTNRLGTTIKATINCLK